jgi:hypothetical protein
MGAAFHAIANPEDLIFSGNKPGYGASESCEMLSPERLANCNQYGSVARED